MTRITRLDDRGVFLNKGIENSIFWPEWPMTFHEAEQFAKLIGIKNHVDTHLITEDEYKRFFPEGIQEKIWLSGEKAKSNKGWLLKKGNYINIGIVIVVD